MSMTVEQVKEAKRRLEAQIAAAVAAFESDAKLTVESVELTHCQYIGDGQAYLTAASVSIRL